MLHVNTSAMQMVMLGMPPTMDLELDLYMLVMCHVWGQKQIYKTAILAMLKTNKP